jgi:hypothetical protein
MVERTEEEKKAWGEKMKAAREAKKEASAAEAAKDKTVPVETTDGVKQVSMTQDQFDQLMTRLNKLETEKLTAPNNIPLDTPATVTASGQIHGVKEKYPINKALYAHVDPRERLFNEPKLSRFAPRENYTMYWDVSVTRYQTQQGVHMSEPRFELELRRNALNEDGSKRGEYVVGKIVTHEDYDAAVDIASALGIEIDPNLGKEFIDEMRYQQFRQWVEEQFFAPTPIQNQNSGKKEMVVGGKVVTFFESPSDLNRELSGI